MALDYDNRTDFRAFDVLISAIAQCTPDELRKARKTCREMANDTSVCQYKRPLWRDMATLLSKQINR